MTGREITTYDDAYAKAAQQYAAQETKSGGRFLSTRAGVLSFDEQALPGNQLACIVLDSVMENTYYSTRFDGSGPTVPPVCYAFGRGDTDMFPHIESMQKAPHYFVPQHIENGQVAGCDGCPKAQWGSSDTGRGKACSNRYRLALLPAGVYEQSPNRRDWELGLYDDPAYFQSAEVLYLKLPVTSGKRWSDYTRMLRTTLGRPPFGAVTRLYLQPDPKTQFGVHFELIEPLPDELAPAIIRRNQETMTQIIQGYEPPDDTQQPKGAGFAYFRR